MKLSFVIPMYNAEKYIEQCINSIIGQPIDKKDCEIIVINDGSKDNSFSKAIEISKPYTNIAVYGQKNKGVSATRNRGIELAKGKYIWFIDADDYIISDTAGKLLAFAEKHQLDILEFNKIRTESRALNKTVSKDIDSSKIAILTGKKYASTVNLNDSCCTNLYRREFILSTKIRFIEGRVMEDMTFNAEIFPKANKIALYPLDTYRYVINPNSIWTSKESKAHRKSIKDFIFMSKKFSDFIEDYKRNNIGTEIIEPKQQNMLFNVAKRLLLSDFKIAEIKNIIKDMSESGLYPIAPFEGKRGFRKIETSIFNKKHLFLFTVLIYRLLRKPIDKFVIKRYQRKKEKHIRETLVKFE